MRDLTAAPFHRSLALGPVDPDWMQKGYTPAGEEVWERTFAVGRKGKQEFVVTILHARSGETRTFYALKVADGDKVPRIPTPIRRQVEAFKKSLETRTQQHRSA